MVPPCASPPVVSSRRLQSVSQNKRPVRDDGGTPEAVDHHLITADQKPGRTFSRVAAPSRLNSHDGRRDGDDNDDLDDWRLRLGMGSSTHGSSIRLVAEDERRFVLAILL
jgi:hypothetical protein